MRFVLAFLYVLQRVFRFLCCYIRARRKWMILGSDTSVLEVAVCLKTVDELCFGLRVFCDTSSLLYAWSH